MNKETLTEFFRGILADELKGTGIEAEVRRTIEGYELRLRYQQNGVVMIADESLDKDDFAHYRSIEAIGLARMMKRAMAESAVGENRFIDES